MSMDALRQELRQLAGQLENLDTGVYAAHGKDPLEPIIGLGHRAARIAFFGRDPGRDEVRHGLPFIGAGGQKVRASLYRHLHQRDMPDFAASVAVGEHFFWANTVPYKPVGNKAWPERVKARFQPPICRLLLQQWDGRDIITLGRDAFFWFAINHDLERKQALETFWRQEHRFSATISIELDDRQGNMRSVRLHPLPHPSPLNARWYRHFPELLAARLQQLQLTTDNWNIIEEAPHE